MFRRSFQHGFVTGSWNNCNNCTNSKTSAAKKKKKKKKWNTPAVRLNWCSSNAGTDFAQHAHHLLPKFCHGKSERQMLSRVRENNNEHRQRRISWRFILGLLISFSSELFLSNEIVETEHIQIEPKGTVLHCQHMERDPLSSAATRITQFVISLPLGFTSATAKLFFLIDVMMRAMHRRIFNYPHIHTLLTSAS